MSWIIKKSATADTYFTGRRAAWSSHMRDACVYDSAGEAQDVVSEWGWPSPDIVVEELPDTARKPPRWVLH